MRTRDRCGNASNEPVIQNIFADPKNALGDISEDPPDSRQRPPQDRGVSAKAAN
jgi:hypothetical protein